MSLQSYIHGRLRKMHNFHFDLAFLAGNTWLTILLKLFHSIHVSAYLNFLNSQEDIAKVIAEIEREEAKRAAASEKTLTGPPSPRAYATLTPHPTTNELILFGGEYHNGKKVCFTAIKFI